MFWLQGQAYRLMSEFSNRGLNNFIHKLLPMVLWVTPTILSCIVAVRLAVAHFFALSIVGEMCLVHCDLAGARLDPGPLGTESSTEIIPFITVPQRLSLHGKGTKRIATFHILK